MEYKKPYLILFNSITDVIEKIDMLDKGTIKQFLMASQQAAEEAFISYDEEK